MASVATTPEPRRIGGYLVGERLAVGGMAEVFLAERVADGRVCVLKVLLARVARDDATVEGLAHEAALARVLVHPGIVQALELVTDGDVTALALELVDGVTLDALLELPEALDVSAALHVTLALLDALGFVHAAKDAHGVSLGIVHRDVSPHNVLVSREGEVKLLDFGIARSTLRDQRTRTGLVKGKLQYLSPEQATGSEVSARTDVYGVALLLYEMLAHRPFLSGDSDVSLLRAAEAPTYVPIDRADVPPRLEAALKKALARFPEERYASARAFRAALEPFVAADARAQTTLGALVERIAPPIAPPVRKAPPRSEAEGRRPGLLAVLAVGLVLTVVAGWYRMRARPVATPPVREVEVARAFDAGALEDAAEPVVLTAHDAGVAPRPTRDAGRREVVVDPPARATSEPDAAAIAPPTISPDVLARVRRFESTLRLRGLEVGDLGADAARMAATLDAALADADSPGAELALTRLEASLAAVRVDATFVRRRIARLDARIEASRARGEDVRAPSALARDALEAYVDGRYDVANARLDAIERALPR